MTTYKFVSNFNEQDNNDNKNDNNNKSFLQIASFPNPKTKTYHVRKFIIDSNNTFAGVKDYSLNKKQFNKLLMRKNNNEYKMYSVYDLNIVNHPSLSDILLLKSSTLNNNYNYYGYAPF